MKYNFHAEDDVELSASEGTQVTVIRKSDKNGNTEWWYVEVDGKKGYIPQSYLIANKTDKNVRVRSKNDIDVEVVALNKLELSKRVNNMSSANNSMVCSDLPDPPPEFIEDLTDQHSKMNIGDNSVNNFNTIKGGKQLYEIPSGRNKKVNRTSTGQKIHSDAKNNKEALSYGNVHYYFMEYSFQGINSGELTVREGELVKVISKHDQKGNTEWWLVDYNGEKGYVPGGFLVFVDEVPMC